MMVNVDKAKGTVLFFVRPVNGIYDGKPQILRLEGKRARRGDRRRPEGHAELLRRGADGRGRQGPHDGE